jgi:hypothetical protein
MMAEGMIETIRRSNLLCKGSVSESAIDAMPIWKIFDLAEKLANSTIYGEVKGQASTEILTHSASLSLGGGPQDCIWLGCRVERIRRLARFALMYSDRVFVQNPLNDYGALATRVAREDEAYLRERFHDDLCVIMEMEPLLEHGEIVLFTSPHHLCPDCLAEQALGAGAGERLRLARKRLVDSFSVNTKATISYIPEVPCYSIGWEGPEFYFEHGTSISHVEKPPAALSNKRKLLAEVLSGKTVQIPQNVSKKLDDHKIHASNVVRSVRAHLSVALATSSSFLTNRELDLSVLQSLADNTSLDRRNAIAFKHLTTLVPFVEDVEIRDLIKLRDREKEAFVQYRDALRQTIGTFRKDGQAFGERDAKALYSDVIAPRLSSLDRQVTLAKRDLISKTYRPFLGLVGAISFGIYSGEILRPVLGFFALTQAKDILEKLMSLGDAERVVASDNMYFLWKVRQRATKE